LAKRNRMKPDFKKLLKKHQTHNSFLDENSILVALEESYNIGKKSSDGEFTQLKETFQSLLHEHAHTCKPNKALTIFMEDWEKRAGIY
jgi:hypothetical protein